MARNTLSGCGVWISLIKIGDFVSSSFFIYRKVSRSDVVGKFDDKAFTSTLISLLSLLAAPFLTLLLLHSSFLPLSLSLTSSLSSLPPFHRFSANWLRSKCSTKVYPPPTFLLPSLFSFFSFFFPSFLPLSIFLTPSL